MPVLPTPDGPGWEHRTAHERRIRFVILLLGLAVLGMAAREVASATTWIFVLDAGTQARDLLTRMFPADVGYGPALLRPLLDTVHIATLGTVLGLAAALPLALMAAGPTSPAPHLMRPIALLLLVTSRSVNSILWALILVVLLGPGPAAGVLAIALRSVGFIGKLTYEALEEAPTLPVLALRTTGATRPQALAWGLLPLVLPALAGAVVYRWEINIREATILGLVGAGGIGMALQASIDALAWSRVSVILLVILATVALAEWGSAAVRRTFR